VWLAAEKIRERTYIEQDQKRLKKGGPKRVFVAPLLLIFPGFSKTKTKQEQT
jgi:hypothetical protein